MTKIFGTLIEERRPALILQQRLPLRANGQFGCHFGSGHDAHSFYAQPTIPRILNNIVRDVGIAYRAARRYLARRTNLARFTADGSKMIDYAQPASWRCKVGVGPV